MSRKHTDDLFSPNPPLGRDDYRRAQALAAQMGLPAATAVAAMEGAHASVGPGRDFHAKARSALAELTHTVRVATATGNPAQEKVRQARRAAFLQANPDKQAEAEAIAQQRAAKRGFSFE